MTMVRSRIVGLTLALLFTFTFTGCASMTVNSYTERGAQFDRYATYGWVLPDDRPTGDPRLDNNPFFFERLQSEVDGRLISRGYVRMKGGTPDLKVRAYVNLRQEVHAGGANPPPGYSERYTPQPYVQETGTLWIDVIDTRTDTIAWRGWAEGPIDGLIDNQAWLEQRIGEIVSRIMEKFPMPPHLSPHDP